MKCVKFYKLENDGTQSTIAKCFLGQSGMVMCEGDENLINSLTKEGIFSYTGGDHSKLGFNDGLRFLEELKYNFKSGYLNASDVMEE